MQIFFPVVCYTPLNYKYEPAVNNYWAIHVRWPNVVSHIPDEVNHDVILNICREILPLKEVEMFQCSCRITLLNNIKVYILITNFIITLSVSYICKFNLIKKN